MSVSEAEKYRNKANIILIRYNTSPWQAILFQLYKYIVSYHKYDMSKQNKNAGIHKNQRVNEGKNSKAPNKPKSSLS